MVLGHVVHMVERGTGTRGYDRIMLCYAYAIHQSG